MPQKINFSADALFDFDKSDFRPEGKAMLDDLTRVLQGATYEVILAIGHADRIGGTEYNQKLSVRRAESVKQYPGQQRHRAQSRLRGRQRGNSAADQAGRLQDEEPQGADRLPAARPPRRCRSHRYK